MNTRPSDSAIARAFWIAFGPDGGRISNDELADFVIQTAKEIDGAEDWEALLSEYRPSMSADVLHAWARDAVDAIRRLAAKPQETYATPNDIEMAMGPDDIPHLSVAGSSVARFPVGSWREVVDTLASFSGPEPQDDQDRKDASDEVIRQWIDRHDLAGALGYGTDARCAFEDAQTAAMAQEAGNG